MNEETKAPEEGASLDVEFHWHSTPQLWSAVRPGYDGATDSRCPMGFGKTKEAAAADLIEQEDE